MYDPANNSSDVSELGPDDLANIVQGVDDMDDALFGFQTKPQEKAKIPTVDSKTFSRPTSAKKDPIDFPKEDLLADISLSDDDFFDIGKKSLSSSKIRDKATTSSVSKPPEEKLSKSKKIANLFGLDDDDDDIVSANKNKSDGAADWLGIKDSPVKTVLNSSQIEANVTELIKENTVQDPRTQKAQINLSDQKDLKSTIDMKLKDKPMATAVESPKKDTKFDPHKPRQNKNASLTDILDKDSETKVDQTKEKRSEIFDELFGNTETNQRITGSRNSAFKQDPVSSDVTGSAVAENASTATVGQFTYTPSSGASRRTGLSRRRDQQTNQTSTPLAHTLFQDEWILPALQQEVKKPVVTTDLQPNSVIVDSAVEMHDNLPSWLGGSNILTKSDNNLKSVEKEMEKVGEKPKFEKPILTEENSKFEKTIPEKTEENTLKTIKTKGENVEDVLKLSTDLSAQTALALQRTEAQLVSALGLQKAQGSLAAVCERQRCLLDSQERQLGLLVTRQVDKQSQLEKKLEAQHERIQQLLQFLAENGSSGLNMNEETLNSELKDSIGFNKSQSQLIQNLEEEVHRATMENKELKMKSELLEKHCKMELESSQILYRREIEFLENKIMNEKEDRNQLIEEFKNKLALMKDNEVELIAQHNERVKRLREEWGEDIRQMMQFHAMTMEQVMKIAKISTPYISEEKKSPERSVNPLTDIQISEKEEELYKKEKHLSALQKKIESQKDITEKKLEEYETKLDKEKMSVEETKENLRQGQLQLKFKQEQLSQEKKHLEEQYNSQRIQLEEMRAKIMEDQTQLVSEQLTLAKEKAKLDALAKLQGVSGTSSFDVLQSKAEVNGALEAARLAELEAVEEKKRLKEKERALDTQRWKLQQIEDDLVARSHHLDQLLQVSEAKKEASDRTLEEAKQIEKRAQEKLQEVERRKKVLKDSEQNLIKLKLDIAQEEIKINRKREQLDHILPQLSDEEAFTLKPIKDVIDPKMLIMKLRAEREMDFISKQEVETANG